MKQEGALKYLNANISKSRQQTQLSYENNKQFLMQVLSIISSFLALSSRSKLLIFQLITIGITFLIFLMIQTQVQNLVLNQTAASSNYLMQQTADKSIQSYQNHISRLMSYHFIAIFNNLENQNRLYRWAQINGADIKINHFQSTLSVVNGNQIKNFTPPNQYEIGIYNQTSNSQLSLNTSIQIFTQILDSFPVNMHHENAQIGRLIISVHKVKIFGVWKLLRLANYSQLPLDNYDPHSRPWYLNQVSQKDQAFQINSVFKNYFFGVFQYVMTSTLQTLNNQIEYVTAYMGPFTDFASLMQIQNIQIMITDQNGRIIQWSERRDLKFEEQDIRIYNQTKTGFNYIDWLQFMKQQSVQKNGISLCENYFCRYNTLTNQYTHTQIISVVQQFYIFIFLNAKNEIEQYQQSVDFHNQMEQMQYELSIFGLFVFIFIILIGQIILYYIFQPFQDLVQLIHKDLDIQRSLNLQILRQQYKNQNMNQLNKLLLCYYKIKNQLSNMQINKSRECRTHESFKYPRTNPEIQFNSDDIEQFLFYERLRADSSPKMSTRAYPKIIRMMSGRNLKPSLHSRFDDVDAYNALKQQTFDIIFNNIQ